MDHPTPSSRLITPLHCARLRHKGMYVMGEIDTAVLDATGPYDATAYWCSRTQKPIGPDGDVVNAATCRHGRGCCD